MLKKLNITLPETVIETVSRLAKKEGTSRSNLISRAILAYDYSLNVKEALTRAFMGQLTEDEKARLQLVKEVLPDGKKG